MTNQVKVIVNIQVPTPKRTLEKQSISEKNEALRELATEMVTDALTVSELQPEVLRVRIAKGDKSDE